MVEEGQLTFAEVIELLGRDERVSIPLLYRLSDLTPEELERFGTAWQGIDEERRRVIVRHLADISEDDFKVDFADVFAICLSDSAAEVRRASLDGLWDTERLHLTGLIMELMQADPDEDVRATAAATLGHFVLLAEWGQIPAEHVEPIVDALLVVLEDAEGGEPIHRAALESIGAAAHPEVARHIERAYDSGKLEMQISSLFAMGRSADPRWLSIIIGEMSSPVAEMRLEAARAAGVLGHGDAVSELAELLSDDDLEIQLAAIAALGQIGSELARGILENLLDDPDAIELHEAAEEALDEIDWLGDTIDLTLIDLSDDVNDASWPVA